MNKDIKQIIDKLYDCVALQLELINQLRSLLDGTEIAANISESSSNVHNTDFKKSSVVSDSTMSHKLVATRYATRSYPMKGVQVFKNPSEDSSDKYFKLLIYSDNTFSFDLCNINDSALQTIKDNNLLTEEVAAINGNITIGSTLKVNSLGSGRVEGRLYYIEQPMDVSIINDTE